MQRQKSARPQDRRPFIAKVALWLALFTLYALTTARDVLPADSGEFQLAAAQWGILHPPGYPLYTVTGALWTHLLPIGSPVFRTNLLSAALAATTVLLTAEATQVWMQGWGMPRKAAYAGWFVAAFTLALAPTFWAQATIANIRMPTLLFAAWALWALARYREKLSCKKETTSPGNSHTQVPLLSLALAIGLGVGHHPSLAFVAIGYAAYLLLIDPQLLLQPRRWWKAALVLVAAWSIPQLYIPLRGAMDNVPLASDGLSTWEGFWHHVLARGFSGDMFAFANPTDLALRLPILGSLFKFQFSTLLLWGALLGWLWLLRHHWRLAIALCLSWIIHSFVTITYRAPQTVEYLMPAYLPIVLALGFGVGALVHTAMDRRRVAAMALRMPFYIALLLLGGRFFAYLPDFLVTAKDTSIRDRTLPLLKEAPLNALILADWRWATPLWVLQQVEYIRPDVEVRYVYPVAGKEYEQVWQEEAESAGTRPLLTTHAYQWDGWVSTPVGGGYRFYRLPLQAVPPELNYTRVDLDTGPLRILGYRVVGEFSPGSTAEIQVAWQASGAQDPAPSLTARLFDQSGALLVHNDRFLGSDTPKGEVRFTNLSLQTPLDRCATVVYPAIGVYIVQNGNFNNLGEVTLPEHGVACNAPPLPTEHPHPGIFLDKGPFLRGVDYNVLDNQATAYLHLCGPGEALIIQSGADQVFVDRLWPGQCRTINLPTAADHRPQLGFLRPDGTRARLITPLLPVPRDGEHYIPFGDQMALVGAKTQERGGQFVIDLTWRSLRPILNDYAVSVRLHGTEGEILAVHDMQPGLGDIPTLKWVVGGARFLDPHPFAWLEGQPTSVTVAVYERFRLSTLPGPNIQPVTFPLP